MGLRKEVLINPVSPLFTKKMFQLRVEGSGEEARVILNKLPHLLIDLCAPVSGFFIDQIVLEKTQLASFQSALQLKQWPLYTLL